MKKDQERNKEQSKKPRRLKLRRETIQILNDLALLEQAIGGFCTGSATFYNGNS